MENTDIERTEQEPAKKKNAPDDFPGKVKDFFKKITKNSVVLTILALLVGGLVGFGLVNLGFEIYTSQEEVFSTQEMSIALSKKFHKQADANYDAVYVSGDVEIIALRDSFKELNSDDMTATEYADFIRLLKHPKADEVKSEGGLTYFAYSKETEDGEKYSYTVYSYKSDEAYWHIYFIVEDDEVKRYADDITEWAKSVSFE